MPGAAPPLPGETVSAQFLRLSQQYVSDAEPESDAYRRSVVSAMSPKPDERASLLVRLAGMIQGDQLEARRVLRLSLTVSQHYAAQVEEEQ